MSGDAPVLALRGLAVGHGARALVSNIDLEIAPGELVALIGPNGSGKTTILRTVAGQLAPLSGSIELAGRDLAGMPPHERARSLASLFTTRPRTDLITARDVVDAGRYPFTGRLGTLQPDDEARVRDAMEATGTWALRNRDFAHMSDGQRQRALIARALVQEPRVLLLDEPTSYLDIRSQVEMLALLRRHARARRVAVVATLHDIGLALRAADRLACIRDGRMCAVGAPGEVLTRAGTAELYGIDGSLFNPAFGSVELPRVTGDPRVFVIAGAGTGADTMRALQRAAVPFAAGVLAEHDVDAEIARSLAVETVCYADFTSAADGDLARARAILNRCEAVIATPPAFPGTAGRNAELVDHARTQGIPVYASASAYLAARSEAPSDPTV